MQQLQIHMNIRYLIQAGALCFMAHASSMAEPMPAQIDQLIHKVKPRAEVLDNQSDLLLQLVLPPQYSQCLYVALAEASQQNNVAHRFVLEQIDFLVGAGLKTSSIQGLIAYGHAITNMAFSSEVGKSVDKLTANDFKERQKYIYRTFSRLSCVNTFSDQRIQPALRDLIGSTRPNDAAR